MLEEVLIGGFGFDDDDDNDMWTPLKSLIKSFVSNEGGEPPLEEVDVSRLLPVPHFRSSPPFFEGGPGGGGSNESTGLVVMFFDGFKILFNCFGPFVN